MPDFSPEKQTPGEKLCVICGKNCAGQPRAKNKHGAYAHETCLQEQRERKRLAEELDETPPMGEPAISAPPLSARVSADESNVRADLIDFDDVGGETEFSSTPCPQCSAMMDAGAVLCLACGFNTASGIAVGTQISKARASQIKIQKADKSIRVDGVIVFAIASLLVFVILAHLGRTSLGMFGAFISLAGLYSFAALLVGIVVAFRCGDTGWGITGVLSLFLPFVSIAFSIYALFISESRLVRWMYIIVLLMIPLAIYAFLPNLELLEEFLLEGEFENASP